MNIFHVAGSAMAAQSQRMNVTASNMANADSVAGPDGQPYRAKQVVFQVDADARDDIGGVRVASVVEDASPLRTVYDPKNPHANSDGYVSLPNVNVVEELVNMIATQRSYEINSKAVQTSDQMLQRLAQL